MEIVNGEGVGQRKKKGYFISIVILICLLVCSGCYIAYDKWYEKQEEITENEAIVFQKGLVEGYNTAISDIIDLAVTCRLVPMSTSDYSVNLISVDCLNLSGQ